jgi:hypothetical protein
LSRESAPYMLGTATSSEICCSRIVFMTAEGLKRAW